MGGWCSLWFQEDEILSVSVNSEDVWLGDMSGWHDLGTEIGSWMIGEVFYLRSSRFLTQE